MKKFLNKPENFVDEMIDGILAAHSDQLRTAAGDPRCIVSAKRSKGKVGIATGGGSGHLPLFLGYVGEGMLDGCAVGGVFQSPRADQMFEVTKSIDQGAGVLYIYGNYGGDIMNFDMAAEMADMESIKVLQVVAGDDVASSAKGQESKRRGVGGIFFVYKAAGAAARAMASLDEVKRIADKAAANVRTMGVALSSCTVPRVGRPTFTIGEDEMEIGMGIHGEPGIRREKLEPADRVAERMAEAVLADLGATAGDRVAVMVNGLGATPAEELYILYRKVHDLLRGRHIAIHRAYVGEFATSMEMAGASLTLFRLDDEMAKLLDAPARTPFFSQP